MTINVRKLYLRGVVNQVLLLIESEKIELESRERFVPLKQYEDINGK